MIRSIIQMGFSGFGDRMRVLCSCIKYAEALNCTVTPVWEDEHWGDSFGHYFELTHPITDIIPDKGAVYPGFFADSLSDKDRILFLADKHRGFLLADQAVPGKDPDTDIFIVCRYNMKPGGYSSSLRHISITDHLRDEIRNTLIRLPDHYECTHIRNTDKQDLLWENKLFQIKNKDIPQVVITDSIEVKQLAVYYGIICVSDIPVIKPDRGVHHIKSDVLEQTGFSKRRLNEGLLKDIFIAGLSDIFNPFKTETSRPGFSTSRFSDFITAGRNYGWFKQQEVR